MRPTSGFVSDHSLGLRLFETEQDDFGEIISELWKSESIFDSRHGLFDKAKIKDLAWRHFFGNP